MRLYTRGADSAKIRHDPNRTDPVMKGKEWAEAFLEMMAAERGASPNTLRAYERDLADVLQFLAARGRDPASATAEDVEAYFADIGLRGLSAATAARRRSAVRQFYRFVLGENHGAPTTPRGASRLRRPADRCPRS